MCFLVFISLVSYPTKALSNNGVVNIRGDEFLDLGMQPNVVCVSEFGCVIATLGGITLNVPLMKQGTVTNVAAIPKQDLGTATTWKNNPLYRTGTTLTQCAANETIGLVGCHLTSFSMLLTYFSGVTHYPDSVNNVIGRDSTPGITNDSVGPGMTCLFNPSTYTSFYSGVLVYEAQNSRTDEAYKTVQDVAFIAPHLNNGKVVIIYGKGSKGTHFVVVKGFEGVRTVYDSGYVDIIVNNFTINDPGANREHIKSFLVDYPTITAVYVFRKV